MYRWSYNGLSELIKSVGNKDGRMKLVGTAKQWVFYIVDEEEKISFYWNSEGDKMMESEGGFRFYLKDWYSTKENFKAKHPNVVANKAKFKGGESRCPKALKLSNKI